MAAAAACNQEGKRPGVSTPYNNRRGCIAQEQQMSRRTAHHRHSMEHLAAAYIPAGPQDRTACSSSLIVLTPPPLPREQQQPPAWPWLHLHLFGSLVLEGFVVIYLPFVSACRTNTP